MTDKYDKQKRYRERLRKEGRCRTCGAPLKLACRLCKAVVYGWPSFAEHMKLAHGILVGLPK